MNHEAVPRAGVRKFVTMSGASRLEILLAHSIPSVMQKERNMSTNLDIYVFTEESLKEHDVRRAAVVHQATVAFVVETLCRKTAGQLLNASRDNGKSLYWPRERLEKLLSHIVDE
jgi:hypothetical protein